MIRVVAIVACVAVTLGDLAQIALLDWRPKFFGTIAGAVLYAALAGAIALKWRPAAFVAVAVPVLPLATLALYAAGVPVPFDTGTLLVLVPQVIAAVAAAGWLRTL